MINQYQLKEDTHEWQLVLAESKTSCLCASTVLLWCSAATLPGKRNQQQRSRQPVLLFKN